MRLLHRLLPAIGLIAASLAGPPSSAQSPTEPPKKIVRDKDGKEVDVCRQSGSVAARLANYRLGGKALDALIADLRDSGVEEAPTPLVEKMAIEVYQRGFLPAEAFTHYRTACPFGDAVEPSPATSP